MVRHYAASILLVCILCLIHFPGSQNFTIESGDRDDHYGGLRDGFLFGHFAFPEATSNYTTLASIESVVFNCLDKGSAQYAMLKFFSVLNLNLVDVAALTPAFPRDEQISHILNGCTPLGKTFGNGMKELLYHVALAVWPWNYYVLKNYGFDLEWHGYVSVARALYRGCLDLQPFERGCALHGAFSAPPLLRSERLVYDIYLRVLAEAHAILQTNYGRIVTVKYGNNGGTGGGGNGITGSDIGDTGPGQGRGPGSRGGEVYEAMLWVPHGNDLERDPQYNLRELQLHYQYMGLLPGILAEAYSLCLVHLYPSLAKYIPPPIPPPPLPIATTDSKRTEADPTLSDDDGVNSAGGISTKTRASTRASTRARTRTRVRTKKVRLGVVSEHEGNSSPGLCVTRIFDHLMTTQPLHHHHNNNNNHNVVISDSDAAVIDRVGDGNVDDGNDANNHYDDDDGDDRTLVVLELVFFCRENPVTVFSEVLQRVADKVVIIDHMDLDGTRNMIASERLDVLLYLALPTEKFTVFLSAARLAPVQVRSLRGGRLSYRVVHPSSL